MLELGVVFCIAYVWLAVYSYRVALQWKRYRRGQGLPLRVPKEDTYKESNGYFLEGYSTGRFGLVFGLLLVFDMVGIPASAFLALMAISGEWTSILLLAPLVWVGTYLGVAGLYWALHMSREAPGSPA